MNLNLNFNIAKIVPKKKRTVSCHKVIENGIEGIIRLNEDGKFVVLVEDKEYNLTKESLETKGKRNLYVFNKKDRPRYVINYDVKESNTFHRGFPFMSVCPALIVKGNLVDNGFNAVIFNINRNTGKLDPREHSNFKRNAENLIDKYNELNNKNTE